MRYSERVSMEENIMQHERDFEFIYMKYENEDGICTHGLTEGVMTECGDVIACYDLDGCEYTVQQAHEFYKAYARDIEGDYEPFYICCDGPLYGVCICGKYEQSRFCGKGKS